MAEGRQKVQIMGKYGTTPMDIKVNADGSLKTDIELAVSGLIISISGAVVNISGASVKVDNIVTVASGVGVIGDFTIASGLHVVGDFVAEVQSGLSVIVASGIGVQMSGVHVVSEVDISSGLHIIAQSGLGVQVESGAYLASGLHIVGAMSVSGEPVTVSGNIVIVESGVHMIQSLEAQLNNYFISDIDESDQGIKFYGYLDAEGNGYIMQNSSGTIFRYASSGVYASNWVNRSGIIYQSFDQEF